MRYNIRADEPGTFHHVICRAVDGRAIFLQESDRVDFVDRIRTLVEDNCFRVHSWVLMSNHFHLLVERLDSSLSLSMQRLLGGYAMRFNRTRKREGHLFQGRFKSILVDKDSYFLELVRYIHLNPLRAGMVTSVDRLNSYKPSGHLHITGYQNYPWQTIDLIRSRFSTYSSARSWISGYLDYLQDGENPDSDVCEYGSHMISTKGIEPVDIFDNDNPAKGRVRVLGTTSFVKSAQIKLKGNRHIRVRNRDVEHLEITSMLNFISEYSGFPPAAFRRSGGSKKLSRYRRILARLLVDDCGLSYSDTARYMGLSVTMITRYLQQDPDQTTLMLEQGIKRSMELK